LVLYSCIAAIVSIQWLLMAAPAMTDDENDVHAVVLLPDSTTIHCTHSRDNKEGQHRSHDDHRLRVHLLDRLMRVNATISRNVAIQVCTRRVCHTGEK
jgi:hypothetical protein